jgi:hypothetical protein
MSIPVAKKYDPIAGGEKVASHRRKRFPGEFFRRGIIEKKREQRLPEFGDF